MMTHEEFKTGFSQLCEAFSVQKPADKAKIFYRELSSFGSLAWDKAIKEIIREHERFPTIAALIQTCAKYQPNPGDHADFSCTECDGRGGVKILDRTYRARCQHGKTMVPQWVPLIPESFDERRAIEYRLAKEWREFYGAEWPQLCSPEKAKTFGVKNP